MPFEELKAKQGAIWGEGTYQNVTETIADVHELIVARLGAAPGLHWLDLACGTGAVAELAAAAGAHVTGIDLAPNLIETATQRAADLGLRIDYRVGDCEKLELPDASFDVVSSTFGIINALDHAAAARELGRVVRPGGTIGLTNWTPEGGIGEMFRVLDRFTLGPAPADPFDWGNADRVRELLGDSFELDITECSSTLRMASSQAYWELFSSSFGPVKTLADSLGERWRGKLRAAWVDFLDTRYAVAEGIVQPREYLLVLGTRR